MRKITKESAKAFVNFEPYKKDNTEVSYYYNYRDRVELPVRCALLYLHGNCIAEIYQDGKEIMLTDNYDDFVGGKTRVKIDLCGWHTPTTRERINGVLDALGYDFKIAQRNGQQVLIRGKDILILSGDRFDPDFAKRVFGSCHFVSGWRYFIESSRRQLVAQY
jgi:hypothetical protein